jgi:thiamine-monophosphate kinase
MPRAPNPDPIGGEEALIGEFWAPLAAACPGALGLKDDAALIAAPEGRELVITTDALIAGVHFFPDEESAAVAWKALAVNVSDLIGKAADPLAYLMSVALPATPDRSWLRSFADGLAAAQVEFGCSLAGGDTDRTPGPLSVSITAIGTVPAGRMVRRSTARPGDRLYVTGTIGDAFLGLALRRDPGFGARCKLDDDARRYLDQQFRRPRPPMGVIVALRACASAAIDVSDGLVKDFDRLCRVSGTGGHVAAARVPLSRAASMAVASGGATLAELMTGGEDYQVLAAVPEPRAAEFEALSTDAGVRVAHVGSIEAPSAGIAIRDVAGKAMVFAQSGWDHFRDTSVS